MASVIARPACEYPKVRDPLLWLLSERDTTSTQRSHRAPKEIGLTSAPSADLICVVSRDERMALEVVWEGARPGWLLSTLEALVELPGLPADWDSYGARPTAQAAVVAALDWLLRTMSPTTLPPQTVPLSNGGVQFEWHTRGIDLEIEVSPTGDAFALFENVKTSEEWEGRLPDRIADLRAALQLLAS